MLNYTYIHRKQSDNSVFYIGKGKGVRAHSPHGRSQRWKRCVAKHGFKVEIVARWPTEQEALDHECFLIKCFREMGVDLCNHTDGGEGVSGLKHSAESKGKMAAAKLGKKQSPETIAIRAASIRGQKRSDEVRAKLSILQQDPEQRAKRSASMKLFRRSEEHERKLKESHSSPERCAKLSKALSGKSKSPEHIAKLCKPVVCLNNSMVFESLKAAVAWLGTEGVFIKSHEISMVLTGKRKATRGYRWAYANAVTPQLSHCQ